MKKRILVTLSLASAFFISVVVMCAVFEKDAQTVRDSVFRFHVIANSDSRTDQNNKLAVRDEIAKFCSGLFKNCSNKKQSMQTAENSIEKIESIATYVLRERGDDSAVEATVTKRYFPTRTYDGVTLPAGVYDTLDIRIGKSEGRNFWCVMFPDICLGASTAKENKKKMSGVLSGGSLNMVTNSENPTVKFKFRVVEIVQSLFRK